MKRVKWDTNNVNRFKYKFVGQWIQSTFRVGLFYERLSLETPDIDRIKSEVMFQSS